MNQINKVIYGDNIEVLKDFPDNYFGSIITDPPYGWSFMGKKWDYDVPSVETWKECLRVLKPGGYILVACGTRTHHRMTVNIEDAGFEIRDCVNYLYESNKDIDSFYNSLNEQQKRAFIKLLDEQNFSGAVLQCYGSGFPKSLNIGKAVDKIQENKRIVIKTNETIPDIRSNNYKNSKGKKRLLANITKGNSKWEGYGTALKPAVELWTLARKPLSEKNVALNVLKWGTGGINIDKCRVEHNEDLSTKADGHKLDTNKQGWGFKAVSRGNQGRFPANIIFDGSDEVVGLFPESKAGSYKGEGSKSGGIWQKSTGKPAGMEYGDSGSAARFFYCAKASKNERNKGCEDFYYLNGERTTKEMYDKLHKENEKYRDDEDFKRHNTQKGNIHPTVKSLSLMKYLCRLITPPNEIVLDPFCGSGSTLIAAKVEGLNYIGIDSDLDSVKISNARLKAWKKDPQIKLK